MKPVGCKRVLTCRRLLMVAVCGGWLGAMPSAHAEDASGLDTSIVDQPDRVAVEPVEPVETIEGAQPTTPADIDADVAEVEPEADASSPAEPMPIEHPNDILKGIEAQLEELLRNRPVEQAQPRQPRQQKTPRQMPDTLTSLEAIATRCAVLANNARDDAMWLNLLNLRARVLAELARLDASPPQPTSRQQEQAQPQEESQEQEALPRERDWLLQLSALAERMQAIDLPKAPAMGGYWMMLAEIASLKGDPETKQARTLEQLRRYVAAHEDNPAAIEWVADTRLSLAQLLDQCGDQVGAAEQLGALGDLPPQSPRYEQTQPIRERIARIGMPVTFEGVTLAATRWSVSDHKGKPILIHIYSDAVDSSVALIGQIQQRVAEQSLGGFSIVSLRVGEPAEVWQPTPLWPVVPIDLRADGLLDQLGVDALPTLIWLDHDGRLASMGSGIAVLDQLPADPDPQQIVDDAMQPGTVDNDGREQK